MKKKIVAVMLAVTLLMPVVTACHDSSKKTAAKNVSESGYDLKEAVKAFKFGDLSDEDEDYTIEMGYNNCDHMVSAIIGEKAGIYKAMGLKVKVTKSAETLKALTSGAMDVGYTGIEGAIRAVNKGAPFFMAAANHLGGSMYLVVRKDINSAQDLKGKTIAMTPTPEIDPTYLTWKKTIGFDPDPAKYKIVDMGSQDACFALKAGKIDAFKTCDPYASIAEAEGFGKIMAIDWAAADVNKNSKFDDWGMCCIYAMSTEFKDKHPELARRLVYAHQLAIKYMYEHPYNAAMMFADGFDVDPYVALRTIYMKTVAEGRTITWRFTRGNIDSYLNYYTQFPQIPKEEIPTIDDLNTFMSTDISREAGVDDFQKYIKDTIDPVMPLGMTFEDWYDKAKEIDKISKEEAVDISDTATPYLNKDLKDGTTNE